LLDQGRQRRALGTLKPGWFCRSSFRISQMRPSTTPSTSAASTIKTITMTASLPPKGYRIVAVWPIKYGGAQPHLLISQSPRLKIRHRLLTGRCVTAVMCALRDYAGTAA
jgi:hypothetical protein